MSIECGLGADKEFKAHIGTFLEVSHPSLGVISALNFEVFN